ncbi:MAG: hypothetical protein ACPLSA_08480, partial [Caldanaerobacter sp.]
MSIFLPVQASAAEKSCSVLFICNEYPEYSFPGDPLLFWDDMENYLAKYNFSLSRKNLEMIRYEDLRAYDIVVFSPLWRHLKKTDITPSEGEALVQYVENGGGLFLLMGGYYGPLIPKLNSYCEKYFGIGFVSGEVLASDDWLTIKDLKPHPTTAGVDKFSFWRKAGALELQPPAQGVAYTDSNCWLDLDTGRQKDPEEPSGPFPVMAVSQYGTGKVVAITDRQWFHDPKDSSLKKLGPDSRKLLLNILQWLSNKTGDSSAQELKPDNQTSLLVSKEYKKLKSIFKEKIVIPQDEPWNLYYYENEA